MLDTLLQTNKAEHTSSTIGEHGKDYILAGSVPKYPIPDRPFKCSKCKKRFMTEAWLNLHVRKSKSHKQK